MAMPLLTTKLHIPPLRRSLVRRSRLLERLSEGLDRRLTLVSAPAGFGKTTLLVEWVGDLQGTDSPPVKVAWLSLDAGDDDPARFFAYLSAAIQRAQDGTDRSDGQSFELAGSYALEPHLVHLINQVARQPYKLLLVLDDYHLITSQAIHGAVAFLIEHLAENMHLVLATRGDPPLPLARLRARGDLHELRQSDLRFTAAEAAAFLNDIARLELSLEDVAALEARTEGWIAGLRMASLAAQGWKADDARGLSRSIQNLTGSHRFILDYLVEEVLDQQTPAVQRFLLETSILERLTGPLCDAVRFGTAKSPSTSDEAAVRFGTAKSPSTSDEAAARSGPESPSQIDADLGLRREPVDVPRPEFDIQSPSQPILQYLEAENLFIVPLDDERRWYRYHRLFADLLRKRLQQTYGSPAPALHRRASEWYEQQGLMAEAIDHALAAKDDVRAATLIDAGVEATFARSEIVTILRWVEKLPDELVRGHPTLCFYHAWALLMSGRSLDTVERDLLDITCEQDGAPPCDEMAGRVAALRAYSLLLQGDMPRAAEMCAQALDTLPEGDQFLRGTMVWVSSLARLFDGRLQDGSQELGELARMGQELGNLLIAVTALCYQARLQSRQGQLYRAKEILERALLLATDRQGRRLPIASEPLIGLGELQREWNCFDAAVDDLTEAIELANQWSEVAALDAYGPLARIKRATGDWAGAQEAIETARSLALRSESTELDDHVVELQHGHLLVAQGDLEGARRWAERRGLDPDVPTALPIGPDEPFAERRLRKYELGVLARLFLLGDQTAEALVLLELLLAEARSLDRTDLIINFQILRALAFQSAGEYRDAMSSLAEALSLAEPGNYVRVFVDEGPAMAALLRRAASRGVSPTYNARLLEAFEGSGAVPQDEWQHPRPQPLIEPLSEREMDVLRLLASGMSNPEIAESLYIAVSTVRSHCKSIYAKLDVHKRWDAVQRAQELGLL